MADRTEWVDAFELDELAVGDARTLHQDGKHVAVFRVDTDELYAVDNRCPHEGYPLAKGYVRDCVVTCPWHNFKFDLRDGQCVMGDEAVRTFPLRLKGERVQVDLADLDPSVEAPRLLASLEDGLSRRNVGQVARNVVRMLQIGLTPLDVTLAAARYDAERAEYGTTHVLPIAVDGARVAQRFEGVEAVLPLMQAFNMAAEAHTRLPKRPTPAPAVVSGAPAEASERLHQLVEREQNDEAEALLRGALERGWDRAAIEPMLYRLCADHFLDFGHALIYQVKIFDLLERVGWQHASALLPAHLVRIANGTREDTLPEWTWFRRWLDEITPRMPDLWAKAGSAATWSDAALFDALVDGKRELMLGALVDAWERGAPTSGVVDAISAAASERMLRFSVSIDRDQTVQEGWLDVTHLLTYANALRHAVQRYDSPDALRLVAFAARFVNNARPLDGEVDAAAIDAAADAPSLDAIIEQASAKRSARAVASTQRYLTTGGDTAALQHALEDVALDDAATRPIVAGHLIKTTVAAFEEHAAMSARRNLPVLAVVRLFASPVHEPRLRRACHEAIRFLIDGKVPRTLT